MRAIDSLPMLFATLLFCGAAVAQDNPFAPDQQTGALNAEAFSNLRRSMNEVKYELSRYKQALNQSQLDLEASRQQTADIQDSQLKLLKTLLKSDDVATQQIGLEQLATSSSTELQGFFRLDDESISILDRFAESEDPTIRKQAIKSLIAFTPKSLELGFQRGERFWLPVAPSTKRVPIEA